jgi:23S rRNA pseudouridine2605 synthase
MAFPPKDRSGRPGRPAAPTGSGTGSRRQPGAPQSLKAAPYKIPAPRLPKAPAAPQVRAPADDGTAREGDRIAKLLARAGVASRREIERYIAEGRIALDGEVITTPATILKNLKGVTVDGNPVAAAEPPRLFMFHKPSGLITAERDPTGRPTIYTALRNALPPGSGRVMPVGRLDINTEGLLLLTNDGELKRAMELPANAVPRTYRARTFGDVTQEMLDGLMEGIEIEGIRYGPINANMERSAGRNKWIELTLTEGKNREVRRVLEHLGLEVSRLLRLRYGPFDLGMLPRGGAEEVPQIVVERFRKGLAGDLATRVQQAVHAGKAYAPRAPKPAEEEAAKPARPARPQREPERPSSRARAERVRPSADAGQLVAKPSAPKQPAKTYPNRPYAKAPAEAPSPGPDARAPSKTLRSSPRKPGGRPGAKR